MILDTENELKKKKKTIINNAAARNKLLLLQKSYSIVKNMKKKNNRNNKYSANLSIVGKQREHSRATLVVPLTIIILYFKWREKQAATI